MNILALETATENCSVALSTAAGVVERAELAPRRHGELLLPMLEAVLAEAGLARRDIDGIAVGRGPGAFTGVRLAVAVAQGLAFALARPAVAVSSLAALAAQAPVDGRPVLAVMDARMGEIYAGAYRVAAGSSVPLMAECVCLPQHLELPPAPAWHVVGSGWTRYAEIIASRLGGVPASVQGDAYPQARHVAGLARTEFAAGRTLSPADVLPVYLRNHVAQTLRERGKPVPALPTLPA